jgi:hypothetical protein
MLDSYGGRWPGQLRQRSQASQAWHGSDRSQPRAVVDHTGLIQAISALNLLLNLFLNSGAESMVQQE